MADTRSKVTENYAAHLFGFCGVSPIKGIMMYLKIAVCNTDTCNLLRAVFIVHHFFVDSVSRKYSGATFGLVH